MTAVAEREYGQLLKERRPHAIRSKRAYKDAMREVEELTIRDDSLSSAETEYYRLLCALVADYERSVGADRWRSKVEMTPLEALRELMEQKGVSQRQVAEALGDRGNTSAILHGRRKISKSQAKVLAELFRVDASLFI